MIEVLVSTLICLMLAGAAVVAYVKVSALVRRTEARVAMHADAQVLYGTLHRDLCALEQDCALVVESSQGDGTCSPADPGSWTLIFMRGKENNEDWHWADQSQGVNTDLLWEKWTWRASSQSLLSATSSPRRFFYLQSHFAPTGTTDFNGTNFTYLPQPRRYLLPSQPEATLNDNMLFPAAPGVYPGSSQAGSGDQGDMQDLDANIATVLTHVTDCSLQLVSMDGTITTVDDSGTSTIVRQGAWLDGRLSANLAQPGQYASSDLAKRPRLLRMRYSVVDPETQVTQSFSFSLPMPGLAAAP